MSLRISAEDKEQIEEKERKKVLWKEENGKGIDDLLASGGAPQYCIY